MKHKKLNLLIRIFLLLIIIVFIYSITIPYEDRGILAFIALLCIFLVICGITTSLQNSITKMNEKKDTKKRIDLKHFDLNLKEQKLIKICPNCKFELKQIANYCPICGAIIKKEQDYIRLLLPNPINDLIYKSSELRYLINVPTICPLCGDYKIKKKISIKPRFYYEIYRGHRYPNDRVKLDIYICDKHAKEMKKNLHITILYMLIFFSFYLSLSFIVVWIILSKTFYSIIILILITIGIVYGFVYTVRKNLKMSYFIRSKIFHEYFPEIGAIIAVQNVNWAKEFIRNNKYLIIRGSIEDFLIDIEQQKKRYEIYGGISGLLFITIALLTVFLTIFIHEIFLIFGVFGVICFAGISIYCYIFIDKLNKKRREEYLFYYG